MHIQFDKKSPEYHWNGAPSVCVPHSLVGLLPHRLLQPQHLRQRSPSVGTGVARDEVELNVGVVGGRVGESTEKKVIFQMNILKLGPYFVGIHASASTPPRTVSAPVPKAAYFMMESRVSYLKFHSQQVLHLFHAAMLKQMYYCVVL